MRIESQMLQPQTRSESLLGQAFGDLIAGLGAPSRDAPVERAPDVTRYAQRDAISDQGVSAMRAVLGPNLKADDLRVDRLENWGELRGLNRDLPPAYVNQLTTAPYNAIGGEGRLPVGAAFKAPNDKSYAFLNLDEARRSADSLGIDRDTAIKMWEAEEAAHAHVWATYDQHDNSAITIPANEVIGDAVSSHVSPEATAINLIAEILPATPGYEATRALSTAGIERTLKAHGIDMSAEDFVTGIARAGEGSWAARIDQHLDKLLEETPSSKPGTTAATFKAELFANIVGEIRTEANRILTRSQGIR